MSRPGPVIGALKRRTRTLRQGLRRGFRRSLEDRELPLSLDMGGDSRALLIAVGGLKGEMAMPPFEFFRATGGIACKRMFVRDLHQAWYHKGLPGYATDLLGVADSLGELISRHDVDRLVLAGSSAGGYAALVFGTLLGADTVLCFGPQTVLDLDLLASIGDHRWDQRVGELAAAGELDRRWVDLRDALPQARRADTQYHVYIDDALGPDRLHAERLLGVQGVRLYRFGTGGHRIARAMRESGALEEVLQRSLLGSAGAL